MSGWQLGVNHNNVSG